MSSTSTSARADSANHTAIFQSTFRPYLDYVQKWHERIRFLSPQAPIKPEDAPIRELFVQPKLTPLLFEGDAVRPELYEPNRTGYLLKDLFAGGRKRLIILGLPGSGKSTLVDYWVYWLCKGGWPEDIVPHYLKDVLPLPLILRELDLGSWLLGSESDEKWLDKLLDAFLERPEAEHIRHLSNPKAELYKLMEQGQVLIMADGYDEIGGNIEIQKRVKQALHYCLSRYQKIFFIATARLDDYFKNESESQIHNLPWPINTPSYTSRLSNQFKIPIFQILPFSKENIEQYANKWAIRHNLKGKNSQRWGQDFVEWVFNKSEIISLARIPLTLNLMTESMKSLENLQELDIIKIYETVFNKYLKTINQALKSAGKPELSIEDEKKLDNFFTSMGFKLQEKYASTSNNEISASNKINEPLASKNTHDSLTPSPLLFKRNSISDELKITELSDIENISFLLGRRDGFFVPRGEEWFMFTSLTFQESFAGKYLNKYPIKDEMEKTGNHYWHNPWKFCYLYSTNQNRTQLTKDLFKDLFEKNAEGDKPSNSRPREIRADLFADLEINNLLGLPENEGYSILLNYFESVQKRIITDDNNSQFGKTYCNVSAWERIWSSENKYRPKLQEDLIKKR